MSEIRDIRGTSAEDYWQELRRKWGALLSYRYIGREFSSMNSAAKDTVVLRHDMRDSHGGVLSQVLALCAPGGGQKSDLEAVPNPVIHSMQILDDGIGVTRLTVVDAEVLKDGARLYFGRCRIVDADNPSRVIALIEGQGAAIGEVPPGMGVFDDDASEPIIDSPDLPPLWKVFGASKRADGRWQVGELREEFASPDAALHVGPQHVLLATAARDYAGAHAGTDQLRVLSAHTMHLARGKTGPFVVDGEIIDAPDGRIVALLNLRDEGYGRLITSATYVLQPGVAVPPAQRSLEGRTIVMSGGSRGIGLAILVAAAELGANAVLLAKTDQPDPRLPGTAHTAVAAIEAAGGRAVAVIGDVREQDDVERAVATAVQEFGRIDICVNNASAMSQTGTLELPRKRFDLMADINVAGTFALTQACLPHLLGGPAPHILTLSPPLNMAEHWMSRFPAYTMTKYAMTLLTLGWAAEFAEKGISANCLWPQTRIATAVVQNMLGGAEALASARDPRIMADAAVSILSRPSGELNGQTLIDADVLAGAGISDLSRYGGGDNPTLDLYVDSA